MSISVCGPQQQVKMVQRPWLMMILALLILLVTGCSIGAKSLTPQDVEDFAHTQHIQPLAVKDVGGVMTSIVYKNAKEVGCFAVWDHGESFDVTTTAGDLPGEDSTRDPITVLYDFGFHNEVVCISINDERLVQHGRVMKVRFPDNEEISEPLQQQKGVILSRKAAMQPLTAKIDITIYDEEHREIYHFVR